MTVHKSDLARVLNDIEFRWVLRETASLGPVVSKEKILQYRFQRGDSFRGWTNWEDVQFEEEKEVSAA